MHREQISTNIEICQINYCLCIFHFIFISFQWQSHCAFGTLQTIFGDITYNKMSYSQKNYILARKTSVVY